MSQSSSGLRPSPQAALSSGELFGPGDHGTTRCRDPARRGASRGRRACRTPLRHRLSPPGGSPLERLSPPSNIYSVCENMEEQGGGPTWLVSHATTTIVPPELSPSIVNIYKAYNKVGVVDFASSPISLAGKNGGWVKSDLETRSSSAFSFLLASSGKRGCARLLCPWLHVLVL
ncbi:unnamed protein product [Urochloa humidicola]